MMKLSRAVPARTKTVIFRWVKREFLNYGFMKRTRDRAGMKTAYRCWWCHRPFADEDMTALASIEGRRNVTICHACAAEAMDSR